MEEKDLIRIYEDAKLDLSGKDLSKLLDKLNTLTQYNSVLDELEEGEKIYSITENKISFREDEAKEGLDREKALSFSDSTKYGYFKLKGLWTNGKRNN